MDVAVWLRSLGLSRYEAAFSDNSIDADILPDLTDGDLAQLGVNLGDRKRLLKAIASLGAIKPAAQPTTPARHSSPADAAERRPVTVMFCDLVGSTSLASKLDAEDWRNLVGSYLDEASAAVTGLGGHVLKKLGDGLMALFGYPHAQENDAERAVRAALAIQRALAELNARNAGTRAPQLIARIGLESGAVVVDATGEVFGEAPNVAARVQGAAEPGAILVTAAVQRQTAGLFVAEDLGAHALKGVSEPVTLYRIVRASGGGRRGGARALTPLVGREEELDILRRRWERARSCEGQLALLVGEPGIGKSRLIEEFRTRLGETPHIWVEWSSSQLLQNTPLHPVAEWGRLRFGADLPAEQRLADLENTLQLVGLDAAEYAPLIAPLVDVPLPGGRRAKFAPEELRRRQLAALVAWFLAGARSQPVVLAFEDLHWADPTSLDLMQTLAERGAQAPLFLVATTRPEFRPPWSLRSHHSVISLAPLDRAQVAKMVGELSSRHALSREVVEGVNERTGGVPLFVEEVTRLLLERGVEGGPQAIPPTLQQSLAARLDRLGPAREIAQIGAVLGRGFSHALLQALADLDEGGLRSAVERLAQADILFVEGDGAQASYRFKHALIQDAAYDSLLKSRRQALHRRAAEALREADAEPEAIAHHFTEAGLDDLAIEWWGKAGDQALRRSAFQEAIAHLGKAIAMADKAASPVPQRSATGDAAASQRLKLQTDYGQAMTLLRGFASKESKAAFARARELAAGIDSAAERFAAYYGQWIGSIIRGETRMARDMAAAFLGEAEGEGRLMEIAAARRCVGLSCFAMGDFADARRYFDQALTDSDAERDADARFRFIHDTEAAAKMSLALVIWHLGEIGRARQLMEEALRRTVELRHAPTTASVNVYRGLLETARGDAQATLNAAEVLVRLGKEHGMALYLTVGELFSSWARGWLIDPKIGAIEYRDALKNYMDQGNKYFAPFNKGLLAELQAGAGDLQSALTRVDEGLALAQETEQHWSDVFLYRLRGEILLKQDATNSASAAEAFQSALAIAQQQNARSFGLRAALSLAKLCQSTGRPVDAHAVLAPALEGFSPTPEMPEIAGAEALLAALAETDEVKTDAEHRQRRQSLQVGLANALLQGRGMNAPETQDAFERAGELVAGVEDPVERLAILYGPWAGELVRGDAGRMLEIAAVMMERAADGPAALGARRCLGMSQMYAGDLAGAETTLRWVVDHYDFDRHHGLAVRFSYDPGVVATYYLAFSRWLLGDANAAHALVAEARRLAERINHPPTIVATFGITAFIDCVRRDPTRALTNAERAVALAGDFNLPTWRMIGALNLAQARADSAATPADLNELRETLAGCDAQGVGLPEIHRSYLAEGYGRVGELEPALALANQALANIEAKGLRAFLPEAHRVRGEILLKRGPADPAPAEQAFHSAIAVAREQGSRSFGLRAAVSLAKLYQSTARPGEARAVLAPALEGFALTPEMPEIAEGMSLLARLA